MLSAERAALMRKSFEELCLTPGIINEMIDGALNFPKELEQLTQGEASKVWIFVRQALKGSLEKSEAHKLHQFLGMCEVKNQNAFASGITGREIKSFTELTFGESLVIRDAAVKRMTGQDTPSWEYEDEKQAA